MEIETTFAYVDEHRAGVIPESPVYGAFQHYCKIAERMLDQHEMGLKAFEYDASWEPVLEVARAKRAFEVARVVWDEAKLGEGVRVRDVRSGDAVDNMFHPAVVAWRAAEARWAKARAFVFGELAVEATRRQQHARGVVAEWRSVVE